LATHNVSLTAEKAHDRHLSLNYKADDLRKVKQYIPEEHKEFYSKIFQKPMTRAAAENE
jgi:hypothetical protein